MTIIHAPLEDGVKSVKERVTLNISKDQFFSLDTKGLIQEKINIDLDKKDYQAHWQRHEAKLWIGIVLCGLYFLSILFG